MLSGYLFKSVAIFLIRFFDLGNEHIRFVIVGSDGVETGPAFTRHVAEAIALSISATHARLL